MKKCLKCGQSYPDNTNFCPECGEKLVEEIVCPKCGAPIAEDDKFCKACGAKLSQEVEKIKEEVAVPAEEKVVDHEENKRKANRVINIIVSAFMLFAATFLIIGVFGNMLTVTSNLLGTESNSSIGLTYFFRDYPNTLRQLFDAYPYKEYFSYSLSMFILESVLYYFGIIACLIFTVFGMIKNIQSITRKQEPHTKLMFAAGASMLPIVLLLLARIKTESSYINVELGWGASLIVSGLVFTLIGVSILRVGKSIINKDNVASTVISTGSALVLFVLLLNAFNPLITVKQTVGSQTIKLSSSGIMAAESALMRFSSSTSAVLNNGAFVNGLISFVFAIAGLVMLFLAYRTALKGNKVSPIVFAGVTFVALIISASLSVAAYTSLNGDNQNLSYSFAGGVVSGIVLLNFVIASLIVSASLRKNKEAN